MFKRFNEKLSTQALSQFILIQSRLRVTIFACLCLILFLFTLNTPAYANTDVLIAYQKTTGFNKQLIAQLEQDFIKAGIRTQSKVLNLDKPDLQLLQNTSLIIAVGSNTTKSLLDTGHNLPILGILIPKHLAENLRETYKDHKHWSNLLIDHPLNRQFHLINSVLGAKKSVGVILGPYSKKLRSELVSAANITNQKLITKTMESDQYLSNTLNQLKDESNVLLTVPDPVIYNRKSIRNILLLSYRNKLPIIGFSKAYSKAGAIASIFSKPEQISQQTINLAKQYIRNKRFNKLNYYPDDFSVATNNKVAHSLGIKLKSSSSIKEQIKQAERRQ